MKFFLSRIQSSLSTVQRTKRIWQSSRFCSTNCDSTMHVKCWNCRNFLNCLSEKFFCQKCSRIQPPVKCVNYFQYLDLPLNYDLDVEKLSTAYKRLQSEVHPDKFSQKSDDEMEFAHEQSSVINKAYRTLSRPLERALYLLNLVGKPLKEEEINMDPHFLEKMLEINETVMETEDLEQVKKIAADNRRTLQDLEAKLKEAFNRDNIDVARSISAQMKYYVSIEQRTNGRLGFA